MRKLTGLVTATVVAATAVPATAFAATANDGPHWTPPVKAVPKSFGAVHAPPKPTVKHFTVPVKPKPKPKPPPVKVKPEAKHITKAIKKAKPAKVDTRTKNGHLINPNSVVYECLKKAHAPKSWKPGVRTIMKRESSNRPAAVNKWDSNAAQGADMRSKGLMQTIGPTFRANHAKGTSWNILDPVANCAAAVNYIQGRYGSIFNVQQANPNLPPMGY